MNPARRVISLWLAVCAAGSGLTLLAASRDWAVLTFDVTAPNLPTLTLTGGEVAASLTPVALAALAGSVAVLAARGVWRAVLAGLIALCGAAIVLASLRAWGDIAPEGSAAATAELTPWPLIAVAGGGLLILSGLYATLRATRWASPARGSRTPMRPSGERELWDALDAGLDPTESDEHR
ncbi:Trp biosynthesis-associated membrane protein [Acrocarpospora sp. B8E8]|uniref:Trp biosynthesis-associated membrane protein n=1 Tax=Acrocarpospora sp. B8E8 TaxID=3153572 RepID=UPI00325E90EB